jgi:hypothetical protein
MHRPYPRTRFDSPSRRRWPTTRERDLMLIGGAAATVFDSRRRRPCVQPFRLAIGLDLMDRPRAHKRPAQVAMTHGARLEHEPAASPVVFGAVGSAGEVVM